MKTVHLITGLSLGGAESSLYKIIANCPSDILCVISLTDSGFYGSRIKDHHIPLICLNLNHISGLIKLPLTIYRSTFIFSTAPVSLVCWMYHSCLLSFLFIPFLKKNSRIVWFIRHASLSPYFNSWPTLLIAAILSIFSYCVPSVITFPSRRSLQVHKMIGYNQRISKVLYNGYTMQPLYKHYFKPSFVDNTLNILVISRYHAIKGHRYLLEAVSSLLKDSGIDIKCRFYGPNLTECSELHALITKHNLESVVTLHDSIALCDPIIYQWADCHILPSISEAFPNVVCETMALGLVNVYTDVGDNLLLAPDLQLVAQPADSKSLASAITFFANADLDTRITWSHYSRLKISREFSFASMLLEYNGYVS